MTVAVTWLYCEEECKKVFADVETITADESGEFSLTDNRGALLFWIRSKDVTDVRVSLL